ncbi:MAG: hypothetical protein RLZZ413_1579 [Pseudomonadota bacterium]
MQTSDCAGTPPKRPVTRATSAAVSFVTRLARPSTTTGRVSLSPSMWGQEGLQSLRSTITQTCSMGAEG